MLRSILSAKPARCPRPFARGIVTSRLSAYSTYRWIDGAEDLDMYRKGGYHPVEIGHVLHSRYEIVDKLGYGGWSTVWLARDARHEKYVALKIGIADSTPGEIIALRSLASSPPAPGSHAVPLVLDEFTVDGPNGSHPCYTADPALCNLRECSFSRLFPQDVARALAYELTLAVAYIHARGFAHGGKSRGCWTHTPLTVDIHLRNVLVKAPTALHGLSIQQLRKEHGHPVVYPVEREDGEPLPPSVPSSAVIPFTLEKRAQEFTLSDARLLLGDFGEAFRPAARSRIGAECHTPVDFRPPDARFEPDVPLSFSADIWSLALAIWDILGMQPLFSSAFVSEDKVVCQIADTLGLPSAWFNKWEARGAFFDGGTPTARNIGPTIQHAFEERIQTYRRGDNMGEFLPDEAAAILDMLRAMLKVRPDERITAEQVLQCEWMVKWAQVDYESSLAVRK